jgi:hypothetical protein
MSFRNGTQAHFQWSRWRPRPTIGATLVIQQAESGRPPLANEIEVIVKGRARVVLTKDVRIPETRALQVFTPLNVQGGTSTRVVDNRMYKVLR